MSTGRYRTHSSIMLDVIGAQSRTKPRTSVPFVVNL